MANNPIKILDTFFVENHTIYLINKYPQNKQGRLKFTHQILLDASTLQFDCPIDTFGEFYSCSRCKETFPLLYDLCKIRSSAHENQFIRNLLEPKYPELCI